MKTINEFMNKNVKTSAYITPIAKNLQNNMTGSENKDGLNNIEVVKEIIKNELLDWCPLWGIGGWIVKAIFFFSKHSGEHHIFPGY